MKRIVFPLLLTLVFAVPVYSEMKHVSMKDCEKDCDIMNNQHDMGGQMDMMGDMMGMCLENADKIGLTDGQKKKVTPTHREMKKQQVRFGADIRIAQLEMKEIMEVKDFDIEKANASVKKIEGIKTAHHLDMLKSMKEVRAVFTEEQFKKLQSMMPVKMGSEKPAKKMKHNH
jgi:Spy/CpxP family protein refolding chaperone